MARENRLEWAAVALLTLVAGVLRIYRVSEVPGGLHGDEALTGIDALRIVSEGWIGPYVGSALGQPTGPLYFAALVFRVSEPTVFTLHLSMALLGVATIPATYFMMRVGFGRWVALIATVAVTFSYWHIFFSRSAFMLISMPLMTTLSVAAILVALRSSTRWPWLFAGLILGLGVYTYNGYAMFVAIVAAFLVILLFLSRDNLKPMAFGVTVLGVGFIAAAFPLIHLAYSDPDFYFQHHRMVSILTEPKLESAQSIGGKIEYLAGRAWDAASLPLRHPEIDYVDGLGGRGTMNPILGLLAYAGFLIALTRWRSPPHLLLVLSFVLGLSVLMMGNESTGELRRPIIVVPFVYGLVGVAVVTWGGWAVRLFGSRGKTIAYAGGAAVLIVAVPLNLWTYFGQIVHEEHMDWVYASDLVDALDAAHEFDNPGKIYFYSGRWSYNYETRLFLYPDTPGIDRSREFGSFSLERLEQGPVTYILLPPYDQEIEALQELHPGGETTEVYRSDGSRIYGVYHLP